MYIWLYSILVISYIILFIWGIFLIRSERKIKRGNRYDETVVILFVIFGLLYDNIIILFGSTIGEGSTLQFLSYIRFWMHALITPTLILFIWRISEQLNINFATKLWSKILAYLLTIGLVIYELIMSVFPLKLKATYEHSLLQYEPVANQQPIMVIVITAVLALIGIILIVKFRVYSLFVGTLLITLGALFAIPFGNAIMNLFELFLLISLLITKNYQIKFCRKIISLRTRNVRFV